MRLRNLVFTRVPGDYTFPVADIQLCGKCWGSGLISTGSFLWEGGSSLLDCLSYP